MLKSFLKFVLIVILCQVITYYIAGIIAQLVLGANEFYPPSPNAISYLRDPHDPSLQLWILPAQALRGLLFAIVLFPFRQRILELGTWYGGLAITGIVFIMGFVAASGGMIEHFVFFKAADYPVKFAVITFVEILIQTLLMGPVIVRLDKQFSRANVSSMTPKPMD
jgi:hypothetical protein